MTVYRKCKKGLLIAASSFNLLWTHKKFLVYFGIPLIMHIILEILVYNMHFASSCFLTQKNLLFRTFETIGPYKFLYFLKILFASFLHLAAINIGAIALSYHTSVSYKKENISIRSTFLSTFKQAKTILFWTICLLIPTITFYTINTYNLKIASSFAQLLYIIFILVLLAMWSLVSSFVIQAIAIDNLGVVAAIRKSIIIIKHIFLEFIGALFWIGLIGMLSAMPFILLEKYTNKFYLITIPLALLIYCTITSAYTVAKTVLYLDYNKQ